MNRRDDLERLRRVLEADPDDAEARAEYFREAGRRGMPITIHTKTAEGASMTLTFRGVVVCGAEEGCVLHLEPTDAPSEPRPLMCFSFTE